MRALGQYDGNLQMFVEDEHELDRRRLRFLRWLGEQGRLEHPIAGPSSGSLVIGDDGDDVLDSWLASLRPSELDQILSRLA